MKPQSPYIEPATVWWWYLLLFFLIFLKSQGNETPVTLHQACNCVIVIFSSSYFLIFLQSQGNDRQVGTPTASESSMPRGHTWHARSDDDDSSVWICLLLPLFFYLREETASSPLGFGRGLTSCQVLCWSYSMQGPCYLVTGEATPTVQIKLTTAMWLDSFFMYSDETCVLREYAHDFNYQRFYSKNKACHTYSRLEVALYIYIYIFTLNQCDRGYKLFFADLVTTPQSLAYVFLLSKVMNNAWHFIIDLP